MAVFCDIMCNTKSPMTMCSTLIRLARQLMCVPLPLEDSKTPYVHHLLVIASSYLEK